MFKGINFFEFLSTTDEWHALVIGFCEVFCPWPARWQKLADELIPIISREYHYYLTGRALAMLCLFIIIVGLYSFVN